MSLLQKASIITTPTAYAEDYLYSIKPAETLGAELVTNGNFATDSNWTKGTGWTIANGKASFDGGADAALNQTNVVQPSTLYRVLFTVLDRTTGTLQLRLGNSGVVDVTVDSNSDFTFDLTTDTSGTSVYFRAIGGFDGSIDNVSVKEIIQADFDFDRNSTGTRVNEDYLIEDVPYNLFTRSEDFSHGAYSKYQASIAETTIQSPISSSYVESISNTNTGTTFSFINQNLSEPDKQVTTTFSVYAKKGTFNRMGFSNRSGDTFGVIYDLNNGTVIDTNSNTGQILASSIQSVGNGFYLCSVTLDKSNQYNIHPLPSDASTASLLLGNLSYTETGNILIFGAQAVKGTNLKPYLKTTDRLDIPRIDYTNGEPSILLEPQRQNLYTYSSAFTNITDFALTVTDNSATSPENLTNATSLVPSTVSTVHYLTFPNTSTGTVTFSVYAKSNGYNFIFLHLFDGSNGRAWFNLETGKVGTKDSSVTSEMIAMPNGWYRCSVTRVLSGSLTQADIAVSNADNTPTFAGDGTSGIFIYGAQLEVGSYATSLIHTSGSTVTRSADAANNAGNSDLFNDSEGVLYCEIKATANDLSQRRITISDGSLNNRVGIEYTSSTNQIRGRVTDGGSGQADMQFTTVDITEYLKIAIKYKVNDCSLYINGKQVENDLSATMPSGLNKLSFDQSTSVLNYYGNVKSVMVFKEALTDLELAKLTGYNNHELYMNYYNRLSYLGLAEEYNVESDINNYIL